MISARPCASATPNRTVRKIPATSRRIVSVQFFLGKIAAVHQPFQAVEARRYRLWLLPAPSTSARSLREYPFPAGGAREGGAEAVRNFMHHRGAPDSRPRKPCAASSARSRRLRDRQDHVIHARVHEILEENFLRAFLFVNARIVRQIVRHRLVAVAQIARAIRRVHHFHRRKMPALRGAVLGRQRQAVLNVRNIFLEHVQLAALRLVAHQDRRAVGSFHAEQIVEISFVRREDDVEFRIDEADPGDVALEILVRLQRVRAQPQKFRERRIVGKRPRPRAAPWPRDPPTVCTRRDRESLPARRPCGAPPSTDRTAPPSARDAPRRSGRIPHASGRQEKIRGPAATARCPRTARYR